MNFGGYIKEIRHKRRLSLRDVSKLIGISNSYLSQIERGIRGIPTLGMILRLASAYDTNLWRLIYIAVDDIKKGVNMQIILNVVVTFKDKSIERYGKVESTRIEEGYYRVATKDFKNILIPMDSIERIVENTVDQGEI